METLGGMCLTYVGMIIFIGIFASIVFWVSSLSLPLALIMAVGIPIAIIVWALMQ